MVLSPEIVVSIFSFLEVESSGSSFLEVEGSSSSVNGIVCSIFSFS